MICESAVADAAASRLGGERTVHGAPVGAPAAAGLASGQRPAQYERLAQRQVEVDRSRAAGPRAVHTARQASARIQRSVSRRRLVDPDLGEQLDGVAVELDLIDRLARRRCRAAPGGRSAVSTISGTRASCASITAGR